MAVDSGNFLNHGRCAGGHIRVYVLVGGERLICLPVFLIFFVLITSIFLLLPVVLAPLSAFASNTCPSSLTARPLMGRRRFCR